VFVQARAEQLRDIRERQMRVTARDFTQNRNRDSAELVPFPVLALACLEKPGHIAGALWVAGLRKFALQIANVREEAVFTRDLTPRRGSCK